MICSRFDYGGETLLLNSMNRKVTEEVRISGKNKWRHAACGSDRNKYQQASTDVSAYKSMSSSIPLITLQMIEKNVSEHLEHPQKSWEHSQSSMG